MSVACAAARTSGRGFEEKGSTMTNPATIDRRDVAHATNPIGDKGHVEQTDKPDRATPLDRKAARLPAGGSDAGVSGMPSAARNDLPDSGMRDDVPPARNGQSKNPAEPPAAVDTNPGRLDQIRAEGRDTAHVQSPLARR